MRLFWAFSLADCYIFFISFYNMTQDKPRCVCVFRLMKEFITQWNDVMMWFKQFLDNEGAAISGFSYTDNTH